MTGDLNTAFGHRPIYTRGEAATFIPNSSFLIPHLRKAFIHNQKAVCHFDLVKRGLKEYPLRHGAIERDTAAFHLYDQVASHLADNEYLRLDDESQVCQMLANFIFSSRCLLPWQIPEAS